MASRPDPDESKDLELDKKLDPNHGRDIQLPVEETPEGATIMPSDAIERHLNNYSLLLLTIACFLPANYVNRLKRWANTEFGADDSMDIKDVFRDLEQKNVIGPGDLTKLREFFWKIQQNEWVHLTDTYVSRDYGNFHRLVRQIRSPTPQTEPYRTSRERPFQSVPRSVDTELSSDMGGDRPQEDSDEQWFCNHYKRRCHVKCPCCDRYWSCHQCHNKHSNCDQKKLESIHIKFIKCTRCGIEQEFSERCVKCNTNFAQYFCSTCKHLTGEDDKPYHCQKCGICRIYKNRSFHCDVCGICLDVELLYNHKCQAESAHDQCCICLEDTFTGCQMLPCSHKLHKECATKMTRHEITRCPICRQECRPVQEE